MTNVTQNFAALVAACLLAVATWTPIVTVPADNSVHAVAAQFAPELA